MRAFTPVRTAEPLNPLLSLAEAKAQLKVRSTDEDDLISSYIAAAEGFLDGYEGAIGRALITQTWSQSFDRFPVDRYLRLPLGPVQRVEVVTYYDGDGIAKSDVDYREAVDAVGPMIILGSGASWPVTADRPDAVTVTWTCGYGDNAADVPPPIIQAAHLLVGQWHNQREAVSEATMTEVPFAVNALISRYRKGLI